MDGDDSNPAVYVYLMPLNYILKNDKFYAMYILPQGNLSSWWILSNCEHLGSSLAALVELGKIYSRNPIGMSALISMAYEIASLTGEDLSRAADPGGSN